MTIDEFESDLIATDMSGGIEDFCRETFLHGTPFIFNSREAAYFSFKRRICDRFEVHHTEIFIVGSAKLGFSPIKKTEFSLDSDIDIAIVSSKLWEIVSELGLKLEYDIRSSEVSLHQSQSTKYTNYLRYGAIGWVRPDLMPNVPPMKHFKQEWFDFFKSISFNQSEVGNYKVTAGVFRSQFHLEKYIAHSLCRIRRQIEVEAEQ